MKKQVLSLTVGIMAFSLLSAQVPSLEKDVNIKSSIKTYKSEKARQVEILPLGVAKSSDTELKNAKTELKAKYALPGGYYLLGISEAFTSFDEYGEIAYGFGPAFYSESTWKNLSTGADSYSWKYSNPQSTIDTITTNTTDLKTTYADDLIMAPVLEAKNGSNTSIYKWGQNTETGIGVFITGGRPSQTMGLGGQTLFLTYGATNLDYASYGSEVTKIKEGSYPFGTAPGTGIVSVCEKFSKPTQSYVLSNVRIGLMEYTAPQRAEFSLIIHRLVDGIPTDTIATATAYSEDIISNDTNDEFFLKFETFRVKMEGGFELDLEEIEVNDEVMLEFTGFAEKSGITLAVVNQRTVSIADLADIDNTAYVYRETSEGTRQLVAANNFLQENDPNNPGQKRRVKTSLAFIMDITYPFIASVVDRIDLSPNPAPLTFQVYSHYPPYEIDEETGDRIENLEIEAPDWVKVDYTFDEENHEILMTVTGEPLPEGVEGRSGSIKLSAMASYATIGLSQGNVNSIESEEDLSGISIIEHDDFLEVNYHNTFSKLIVYNVNGMSEGTHSLSASGTLNIKKPTSKGVILFNFVGENTSAVKKYISK